MSPPLPPTPDAVPPAPPLADRAPTDPCVTAYDRAHLTLYLRLLDAEAAGAPPAEVAAALFEVDAAAEPERAAAIHESHLRRAHWMSARGYRDLLATDGDMGHR